MDAEDPIEREIDPIPVPFRLGNEEIAYQFEGWSWPLEDIRSNLTIRALFSIIHLSHRVEFYNGTELIHWYRAPHMEMATYDGYEPQREGHRFSHWYPELTVVDKAQRYDAIFIEVKVPHIKKPLDNCSWGEIRSIGENGYVDIIRGEEWWCTRNDEGEVVNWFAVGDIKNIKLNTGEEIRVVS